MDKVFKAFDKNFNIGADNKNEFEENLNTIYLALAELEGIKEAEPSEALECLKALDNMEFSRSIETYVPEIDSDISETQYLCNTNEFYIVKQALLKAQAMEQVLKDYKVKDLEELDNILWEYRNRHKEE